MKKSSKQWFTLLLLLVCNMALAQTNVVEFDFTDKTAWTYVKSNTYTNSDGYTITWSIGSYNKDTSTGKDYIIVQRKDATLTLPTFTFDVEKIEVVGNDGASQSVKQNIYVGSTAVSTEATGSADSNSKAKTNEFVIKEDYRSAGKIYKFKNVNDANSQITYIRIYPVGSSSSETTPTATTTTFGSDVDGKAFIVPDGGSFDGKQATVTPTEAEGTLTYSSDNTAVATVGATDGAVTLVGAGDAKITATFTPADATKYAASSAYYTITYNATTPTTLAFAKSSDTAYMNLSYTLPALTLKAADKVLTDATYTYISSNENVATVANDGTVSLLGEGSTTITARYDDATGKYQSSTATLALTVANATLLNVLFDGSKDKSTTNILEKDGVSVSVPTTDDGSFRANFNLGTAEYSIYGNEAMTISTTRGNIIKIVLKKGTSIPNYFDFAADGYTVNSSKTTGTWTGKAASVTLENKNSNRSLISSIDVTVSLVDDITLHGDENNDALLARYINKVVDAKVSRTLETDNGWYTLCLPFNVDADSMGVFKGAQVLAFEQMDGYVMRFGPATSITAGQAYLVKPATTLNQPVFKGVVISTQTPESASDAYSFVGTFSPTTLTLDGTNLFLGDDNTLFRPASGKNIINGLRGYFVVPSETEASKLSIAVDDEPLSIADLHLNETHQGKVYNLQGQRIDASAESLPRGIYIVDGRKVVVR